MGGNLRKRLNRTGRSRGLWMRGVKVGVICVGWKDRKERRGLELEFGFPHVVGRQCCFKW